MSLFARLTALLLGLFLAAAPAVAADPASLASSGAPGLAPCASCHLPSGVGQAMFPRLAGMDADYLARQLDDFADGTRPSPIMQPIATALVGEDRKALAGYYATLPLPETTVSGEPDPLGERIALHGAWDKDVPACVQCHGPGGRGVGAAFPALAAQPAEYISGQLKAFRDGVRANDPLQLMRAPAANLGDEEIAALARWFAAQPARAPERTP
jgi:cytochrome c553